MSSQRGQCFVPSDGIAREILYAGIQRYLGPDALVNPGEHHGVQGYWITAYKALTSQMLQELQSDSQRWQIENGLGRGGMSYQDSSFQASRQYHGSTTLGTCEGLPDTSYARPSYDTSGSPNYTSQPSLVLRGHGQHRARSTVTAMSAIPKEIKGVSKKINPRRKIETPAGAMKIAMAMKSSPTRVRGIRCPFYCHDPDRYCQQACSGASGFPNLARLVQHLKRGHWQSQAIRCPRCQDTFTSNHNLEVHLNASERCPKRERLRDDRISDDQWQDMTGSRPKDYSDYTVEQKWQHLYRALFPGDLRVPSAYARPITIDQLQDPLAAAMEEYLAEQWGPIVCEPAQSFVSDLKKNIPMILQRAQEKIDSRCGPTAEHSRDPSLVTVSQSVKDQGNSKDANGKETPNTASNSLDPDLVNIFTSNPSEPRLSNAIQLDSQKDADRTLQSLPNKSNALCLENDTFDPLTLGTMDFDTDVGNNNALWDDALGGILSTTAMAAENGMHGSQWGF